MKLICPSCGATSEEVRFSGPFCMKCKPVSIKCPKRLVYMRCGKCGKFRFKGNWVEFSLEKLEKEVISKCSGEFLSGTYNLDTQEATFYVGDKKEMYPAKMLVPVELEKVMCPECSRKSGGYFEAIIQLRGQNAKIKYYQKLMGRKLSLVTFITKEETKKEGIDMYIGSSRAVVEVLSELGLRAKISRKLSGQKDGKRLYRTTFMIRAQ